MGDYINKIEGERLPADFESKSKALIRNGAVKIEQPTEFQKDLVCLVNNGFFAAAGYCKDEREFNYFSDKSDPRPKHWFIIENAENHID